MGHDVSKSITPPPLTFQDCFLNDQINISRYLYYCRTSDSLMQTVFYHRRMSLKKRKRQHVHIDLNKKQKRNRSVKNIN